MPSVDRKNLKRSTRAAVWTAEEFRTIFLLFESFSWETNAEMKTEDNDIDNIRLIFHHLFPYMETQGRNYSLSHLRDQWTGRHSAGRNKMWRTIDRSNKVDKTPYTKIEVREFKNTNREIDRAAEELQINMAPVHPMLRALGGPRPSSASGKIQAAHVAANGNRQSSASISRDPRVSTADSPSAGNQDSKESDTILEDLDDNANVDNET